MSPRVVHHQHQTQARYLGASQPVASAQDEGNSALVNLKAACDAAEGFDASLSLNSGRLRLAHFFQVNSKVAKQFLAELIQRPKSHFINSKGKASGLEPHQHGRGSSAWDCLIQTTRCPQ